MTVEIWFSDESKEFECRWGTFENSECDPKRPLRHLMLTTAGYVRELLDTGPKRGPRGGTHSASIDGERIFAHLDYAGSRTIWELFEAHFWDNGGPDDVLIGRWPD